MQRSNNEHNLFLDLWTNRDEQLHQLVEECFAIDSFGTAIKPDKVKTRQHVRAEEIMKTTIWRVSERRPLVVE